MPRTIHADELPTLEGKWCYYVNPTQDPAEHGGYVPSVVEAGKPGYWPLIGREGGQPWIWGTSLQEAEATCESLNAGRGLAKVDAIRIVLSSMGAGQSARRA
jgi:hypothetical protein